MNTVILGPYNEEFKNTKQSKNNHVCIVDWVFGIVDSVYSVL